MKTTRRWRKKSEIYRTFAFGDLLRCNLRCSLNVLFSTPRFSSKNGFAIGKKWSDWQVNEWREWIRKGWINGEELLKEAPRWWLKEIFKDIEPDAINKLHLLRQ